MTAIGRARRRHERRVLVVEDRAHRPLGHFPNRFAELAEGFVENGCVVEILTAQGWLHDGERPVPFVVNRYGWFNRLLCRAGESFARTRGLRRMAIVLRALGMVRAVRARCRRAGDPMPDVVVVSMGLDPVVASALARRGRWLFYAFGGPSGVRRGFTKRAAAARVTPARGRWARRASRHRTPTTCARWQEIAPFLDPVTLPITGVRPRERTPRARRRLGLDDHDKVALVFGTAHGDKDVDLVARVFAELSDWQLVVAGQVADEYRPRASGREAILIGGYIDTSMRDVVYSAADLVVLSFKPSFRRNSGVLVDAISLGVPVVCSDGSIAADVVREYRLGVVFDPGNPDSLERAVKTRAGGHRSRPTSQRARTELSNRAVAARFLDALEYCSTRRGRSVMTTTQATNIVDYKNGAATIDADGHVNETGHLGDYIDPAHRSILELPPGTVRALHATSGRLPHAGHVGPDGARAPGDPGRQRRRRPPARHGP